VFGTYPAPYSDGYTLCELMARNVDDMNERIKECYESFEPLHSAVGAQADARHGLGQNRLGGAAL
jgi:hypothetical protein